MAHIVTVSTDNRVGDADSFNPGAHTVVGVVCSCGWDDDAVAADRAGAIRWGAAAARDHRTEMHRRALAAY